MSNTSDNKNSQYMEVNENSNVVGFGNDADYDTHSADVQNGLGYYDNSGRYHSFTRYDD